MINAKRDLDQMAIDAANQPEGWLPFLYERAANGIIVTGCMTTPKTRGPNKGSPKYLRGINEVTVVVPHLKAKP